MLLLLWFISPCFFVLVLVLGGGSDDGGGGGGGGGVMFGLPLDGYFVVVSLVVILAAGALIAVHCSVPCLDNILHAARDGFCDSRKKRQDTRGKQIWLVSGTGTWNGNLSPRYRIQWQLPPCYRMPGGLSFALMWNTWP